MGDSDDEYDRKRRDKFRGERTEGGYTRENRRGSTDGRREDWPEREPSRGGWPMSRVPRPEYRDYRGGGRERYSPVPPMKRYKPDGWDDRRYGDFGFRDPWLPEYPPERSYAPPVSRPDPTAAAGLVLDTQPAMMSFKAFLQSQDDAITDEEAMTKYNEYKQDFKRQQLNEFFVAHKDEEWFKVKYHPEESVKRKEEQLQLLKNRLAVFNEFMEKGFIDGVQLDADAADSIIRLMDRVVIRLEGGDENDWIAIEKAEEIAKQPKLKKAPEEQKPIEENNEDEKKIKKDETQNEGDGKSDGEEKDTNEEMEKEEEKSGAKKRKRDYDFESGSESDEEKLIKDEETKEDKSKAEGELESGDEEGLKDEEKSVKSSKSPLKADIEEEIIDVDEKRKDLHKTSSIFFRNLSPAITKAEVEAMCKRYPGFLRVALAEPQYERRWLRRGWVTFERNVNIKEICWNLNNIRLKDCELGAIVNKDLSRRVRTVSGITAHKQVVRNDIKLAANMVHTLDGRYQFWVDKKEGENGTADYTESFGLVSNNPVLKNITDYIIEEASAEEEELLGNSGNADGDSNTEATIERDETLIKVLDRLLLYLRIIYSIDYYNHCEYPQEDEMPNRCGLIHVRNPPPSTKVTQDEIQDYCRQFKIKIAPLAAAQTLLSTEAAAKLGAKDPDKEVEKFIQANTQELAKDKWLCPLSGKKFKGPDFVRKHIQNKHGEKIQEVIKEVEYFNNYLADPKRPQLPENPGVKTPAVRKEPEAAIPPPAREPLAYPPPYGYYPPRGGFYGGYGFRGAMRGGFPMRGRGGLMPPQQDFRPVIHYRDLDAPREPEDFI